jgi:hypothetical protein
MKAAQGSNSAETFHDKTLPAEGAQAARFCSICGRKLCRMNPQGREEDRLRPFHSRALLCAATRPAVSCWSSRLLKNCLALAIEM